MEWTALTKKLQQQTPSIIQGYFKDQGGFHLNPKVLVLEQDDPSSKIIFRSKSNDNPCNNLSHPWNRKREM